MKQYQKAHFFKKKKKITLNVYVIWSVVLSVFLGAHASLQADPFKKYIVDFSFFTMEEKTNHVPSPPFDA